MSGACNYSQNQRRSAAYAFACAVGFFWIPNDCVGLHVAPIDFRRQGHLSTTACRSLDVAEVEPEYFSVAPMMGHTHRHYRRFFGLISKRAWLYTEMIPAGRLVQSFLKATEGTFPTETQHDESARLLHPEKILQHVKRLQQDYRKGLLWSTDPVLQELLHPGPNPAALQLGGRDPDQLAHAAAIASAFGYGAVNLNCGCPSTSVSARATGAALMREPELVAACLEAMSESMDQVNSSTILSVKHRLGIADAKLYDATCDHAKDDQQAYQTCRKFMETISLASKLSRVQVHARIALLGFDTTLAETESKLWTPASSKRDHTPTNTKVNHQRVQYQAKRRARQVTLQNRSVPPLRPGVVKNIATDLPHLQVSTNGGIQGVDEIRERLSKTDVVGAMVGRAAINHPCSFAAVDDVLWGDSSSESITRRKVLLSYIDYCSNEELQLFSRFGRRDDETKRWRHEEEKSMAWHRRRLVAPAFHLMMGELGNETYQRRLRKLVSRADRHSASSMLSAAMAEVPISSLDKPLHKHTAWEEISKYEFTKRSGAMQRTIY